MDKNDTMSASPSRRDGDDRSSKRQPPVSNVISNRRRRCPVSAFQKMISGKYKLRILWDLKDGPLRYGEIKSGLLRGVEGTKEIAPRVLSRELKALAQSGLITRKDYHVVPPKVEYRLTAIGRSFVPVIAEIRKWGERHLAGERLRLAS
jgi:DNA-binding HxlR family transcriptional regulator